MNTTDLQQLELHGHSIGYRIAGEGDPAIVLIHGMAGCSETWLRVLPTLGRFATVIAPDLLGHGASAKPRGDYSLGALACGVRDLMMALGHDRATIVGHSLGGGVAMQFAYQFPERCERLVLVSAGGLGLEVGRLLRLLSLPGAEYLLAVGCAPYLRDVGTTIRGWLTRAGVRLSPSTAEIWRSYSSLADPQTRKAFLHTLRAVVDVEGQRVGAHDRLYLASDVPTLIVWGDADPIIPVAHAHAAHEAIPGSRLEVFEGSGHYPHSDQPVRFAEAVEEFLRTTEPADLSVETIRSRLRAGSART